MDSKLKALNDAYKIKIARRREANKELLKILDKIVDAHPTLRLGQILINAQFLTTYTTNEGMVINDPFYEEPLDTLKRVKSMVGEL